MKYFFAKRVEPIYIQKHLIKDEKEQQQQ